ncbi:hypothetical protein ACJJIF_16625 [Microbulbifer sp. SSSA002]|uniref:hypothetical protein n=1 Tax=Microbulbifer sp. SSSA002 TaxID=3243376 RepID=UPI004039B63B
MKNIHQPIKDIISYYASKLSNQEVLDILQKNSIESKREAKDILLFLDSMCIEISKDAQNNTLVLRQPIKTVDAEKVCDIIEDYIEAIGYGNDAN